MKSEKTILSLHQSPTIKAIYDWIEGQNSSMIEDVKRWSLINSGSANPKGLSLMQDELINAFSLLDCEMELVNLPDGENVTSDGSVETYRNAKLLRFYKRPKANRKVLLTGHYDTVFNVDHSFQTLTMIDDNTLNGPGVADMKGGILIILNALIAFEKSPFADALGWEVLLSPDEETGSLASAPYLVQRAVDFDMGLTYEPAMADGTLAGERKGSGNFTVVVKGRSAHAGREFHLGRNAIVAMADIIGKLDVLTGKRSGLTVNPAVIKAGVANNVVPDTAVFSFNVRLENSDDRVWLETEVSKIIDFWNIQDGFQASLHGGINRPPKNLSDANLALMELIKTCGELQELSVNYVATGGCCEGNNLAAAGLANVDTLGVRGGAIHSADEYLLLDSMVERAKLSFLILVSVSNGCFDNVIKLKSHDMMHKGTE